MNTSYLPSRKILYLIGGILVIGAVTLFLFGGKNSESDSALSRSGETSVSEKDTDGDGLADWEEVLWNTDINNPDTDGDGTSDGEEVRSGRHPKIPGPNDHIDQDRIDAVYSQNANVPVNVTETAWRDLLPYMASYLSVSGDGKGLSEEQKQEISAKIAAEAESIASNLELRGREDLKIHTNVTFDDIDNYFGNLIDTIGRHHASTNIDDELIVFAQAVSGSSLNEERLVALEVIATDYQSLANKLTNTQVPNSLVNVHLALTNNFLELSQAVKNMSTLEEDPIRSMAGLERYRELIQEQQEINQELGERIGREARALVESE